MQRDYSTAWEEHLVGIAKQSNNEKNWFDKAVAFCRDMTVRFTMATGLLSLDGSLFDFDGDIASYQTCVIDAENLKESEIRRIFEECRGSDSNYAEGFTQSAEVIRKVGTDLQMLADAINPSMNILLSSSISSISEKIGEDMAACKKQTGDRLTAEIKKLENLTKENAKKELVTDALAVIGDLCVFVGEGMKGNVVGMVDGGFSFLNDFMAGLEDGGAWLTASMGGLMGSHYEARLRNLEDAEKMRQQNSVADIFHGIAEDMEGTGLEGFVDGIGTACDVAETIQQVYETADAIKDFGEGLGDAVDTLGDIKENVKRDGLKGLFEFETTDDKLRKIDKKYEKAQNAKTDWYRKKRLHELDAERLRVRTERPIKNVKRVTKVVKRVNEAKNSVDQGQKIQADLGNTKVGGIIKDATDAVDAAKTTWEQFVMDVEAPTVSNGTVYVLE